MGDARPRGRSCFFCKRPLKGGTAHCCAPATGSSTTAQAAESEPTLSFIVGEADEGCMRRRRLLALGGVGLAIATSGCSETIRSAGPNCDDGYRDLTIGEIEQSDQDAYLYFAGKITENPDNQDWLLFSDGTGTLRIHPESRADGQKLMEAPMDTCLEISGRVGSIVDSDELQTTMYLGKLEKVIETPEE